MSVIGDLIKATLRDVPTLMGDTWSYRTKISAPTAQTSMTYSEWTTATGILSGFMAMVVPNDHGALIRREIAHLRYPDTIVLKPGDEVSTTMAKGDSWSVQGQASSGPGTVRYTIQRDVPLAAQRHGGGP